jgi:hypothetical protein
MSPYTLRTHLESLARIYKDRIDSVGVIVSESHNLPPRRREIRDVRNKILDIESNVQDITGTKKGSDEPILVPELRHCGTLSVTHVPYRIVNLAHVKDRSQATLRRKRFHHELMHGLTNPRIWISKQISAHLWGLHRRRSAQRCWSPGIDRRRGSLWRKCLVIFHFISHSYPKEEAQQQTLV